MKTMKLMFVMFISLNSFAQQDAKVYSARESSVNPLFTVSIVQPDPNSLKFKLDLRNQNKERVVISIVSETGVLYESSITEVNFTQTYDLSSLEDGQYWFEIGTGKEKIKKKIEINTVATRQVRLN